MKHYYKDRLSQLSAKMIPSKVDSDLASWIQERTLVGGKPWSYSGHEYQEFITRHPAKEKHIMKCSQIGMSALSIRWALGFGQLNPGTTVLYSLPTAGFASKFGSSRYNKLLRSGLVDKGKLAVSGSDSATYKAMINGSEIYFLGGVAASGQISIPADCLIFDEVCFVADLAVTSMLQSRLTHSKHKISTSLSTPLWENYAIADGYNNSKQYVELQRCSKCSHTFHVDYFKHVKIPEFSGDIREFNFQNKKIMQKYAIKNAFVQCPKCKRPIDQHISNREWVCVNPDSNAESAGFWVTPFSAPTYISATDLIKSACKYVNYSDHVNFSLGSPYSDSTTGLTKQDIEACFVGYQDITIPYTVMGLDVGGLSACTIAKPGTDGGLDVVHTELIPLKELRVRVEELRVKYNVICTVIDALPYTETVLRIQLKDHNSHAALFGSLNTGVKLYDEKVQEEDDTSALSGMRVVQISRERMLDYTASMVREGSIKYLNCEESKETIVEHLTDLKRGKAYDKNGELVYKWKKSSVGNDHYFFSLLYCITAGLMKGFGEHLGSLNFQVPLVQTFEVEDNFNYEEELRR